MNFRKFKKNAKALSPVVASIILIAVTVAVSVVVAAWMGGMTIGLMGNAEQAKITNDVLANSNSTTAQAVVTVQNTGSATVDITSATIDGHTATVTAATGWTSGQVAIPKGTSVDITIAIGNSLASQQFSDSAQYTIKLMTAKGNTITDTPSYTGP